MKLSVIIPTYNRGDLLRESVGSVLRQPCPVQELIIADDGSRDQTLSVCQELQRQTQATRIIISRTEENRGAQVARNRGFSLATGEAVMFLDSDDALADDGLTPLMYALEEDKRLDFVYGQIVMAGPDLTPLPNVPPVGADFGSAPVELAGWHWAIMGAIYRRDLLERVGPWNESLTGSQDWEYQARVKLQARSKRFFPKIVALWRQHESVRVGTRAFRYDYVQSVIEACLSIGRHARAAQRYDEALANKLARKMFLHGLEFSVHAFPEEARHVFKQVKNTPEVSFPIKILASVFTLSPRMVNSCVFRAVRATR